MPPLSLEVMYYKLQKEMWTLPFVLLLRDMTDCAADSRVFFLHSKAHMWRHTKALTPQRDTLAMSDCFSLFLSTQCPLVFPSEWCLNTDTHLSSMHPALWPIGTDSHYGHSHSSLPWSYRHISLRSSPHDSHITQTQTQCIWMYHWQLWLWSIFSLFYCSLLTFNSC